MTDNDLNEEVEVVVDDADVITVPIDDTLSNSGEAADAKAVGDALALKADRSEVTGIDVNGEEADNQGHIILSSEHIPVTEDPGSPTVAEVLEGLTAPTAETIPMSDDDSTTIAEKIENMLVNGVPYAENLKSDDTDQVNGAFLARTTGGEMGINGTSAWLLRLRGNRDRTGYVEESIDMTVIPMERTAPAAITAVLDKATFEAYVETAGTYTLTYGADDWDNDPTDYGVTVSNTPVTGDEIVIVWDGEEDPVMTVNAVERHAPPAITATLDRDTFVAYVQASGTITLTFTTAWSADPTLYGITVENTPIAGDQIVVVYVKEVRGTITQSNPTALIATGWNLYNNVTGYAKVVKYSDTYGYKIGGTYSSIAFGTTPDAASPTAITPDADGLFTIDEDGYVFVTGGNSSSTYIIPTWSDWIDGPSGSFESYRENTVNLANIMSEVFPSGLMQVGNVRDEIDFNAKMAYIRVSRLPYTEANREQAAASGRAYEFDENYIYLARATEQAVRITADEAYTVDDHGLEFFTGGSVAVYTEILYGVNLKDKLRRDVITRFMTVSQVKGL